VCVYKSGDEPIVHTQQTTMSDVHDLVNALTPNRENHPKGSSQLLYMLNVFIDQLLPYLDIKHVALLASSCKSFRVLTTNLRVLDYVFKLMPPLNAVNTRKLFLVPRQVKLVPIGRHRYDQVDSFVRSMNQHGGLENFRGAVTKRRHQTKMLREGVRVRKLYLQTHRIRRAGLVEDALDVVGLDFLGLVGRFNACFLLFVNRLPTSPAHEEFLLAALIEKICWNHYLLYYTEFKQRCADRVEMMGEYPGLERDIASEFEKPEVWPWLV
jgi:hypothetical protein